MPKSYDTLKMILDDYANLKNPTTDILPDFAYILEYQIKRFKDCIPDSVLKKLTIKLDTAKKMKSKPHSKNRLYLITDIDIPELILFDVEQCILEHLMYACDIIGINDPSIAPPNFSNTLFIFSSGSKPYAIDLYTKTFTEILRCFHAQNALSNATVRESWCNRPRRHGKDYD